MNVIAVERRGLVEPWLVVVFAATCWMLVGAAVVPTKLIVVCFGGLIALAIMMRAHRDTAMVALVYLAAVAVIPASLTVPTLGSLGSPQMLISLVALGVWFIDWLVPSELPRSGLRPIPIIVVAFVAANFASYAAAGMRAPVAVELSAADRGMIIVVGSAGIALLIAESLSTRDRLDGVVKGIVLAGTAIAVVGIIQFVTGFDPASQLSIPGLRTTIDGATFVGERSIFRRVAGTTLHAIEFSAVLCIVLPLAIHLAMCHGRRWYIAAALIGAALPMSVSRTAAVGLAAVVVCIVPAWTRVRRRRFYLGAAIYLVVMRVAFPGLLGTIRALFVDAGADPSISSRRTDYDFISEFVGQRPIFGRGYATLIPTRYDFLDNQYLLSLVETGYVGVALYFTLICGSMLVARLVRHRVDNESDRDLAQALFASLAVVAATSAAFDFLSFPSARAMLFVVVGCIGALWRLTPRPDGVESEAVRATTPASRESALERPLALHRGQMFPDFTTSTR